MLSCCEKVPSILEVFNMDRAHSLLRYRQSLCDLGWYKMCDSLRITLIFGRLKKLTIKCTRRFFSLPENNKFLIINKRRTFGKWSACQRQLNFSDFYAAQQHIRGKKPNLLYLNFMQLFPRKSHFFFEKKNKWWKILRSMESQMTHIHLRHEWNKNSKVAQLVSLPRINVRERFFLHFFCFPLYPSFTEFVCVLDFFTVTIFWASFWTHHIVKGHIEGPERNESH